MLLLLCTRERRSALDAHRHYTYGYMRTVWPWFRYAAAIADSATSSLESKAFELFARLDWSRPALALYGDASGFGPR